jgi:3'(2'), 5'-bisphosphate nucleotidase
MSFTDAALARRIADTAGRLLLSLRDSGLFEKKALGKAGDQVSHRFIMEALAAQRPQDAVLSEEEAADPARLKAERVWIVDPLDGTREYSELRTDWAVHVALTVKGLPVAGAVALPGLELTLSTDLPPALPPAHDGTPRILVSRTRPPMEAEAVAKRLGATLVPMGSAGAKSMGVLRGEAEAYIHAGGQHEWDSCAPVAVAIAAGLHASRLDGSPCLYNRPDTAMPDILICRAALAPQILGILAETKR